jgi:deferrochelatase/peroxidase EfeB
MSTGANDRPWHLTRRGLLRSAGAAGVAGATGLALPARSAAATPELREAIPFFGAHQQGIATPQQPALCLAAFDANAHTASALRALLRAWSAAAERMARGLPALPGHDTQALPPHDSGETQGLLPGRLTVTFGLGPSLFSLPGLAAHRPPALRPLPAFPGDRLDGRHVGGDLVVQACAEDPMVAFHAVRMLHLIGGDAVRLRWTQTGFLPSTYRGEQTPRNLLGMKDGTLNPRPTDADFAKVVWIGRDGQPAWMRGGTYMVFRRIRMNLPRWDASSLADQEQTIGRRRDTGAPLGGRLEHDPPDLQARDRLGQLLIPATAHVRLAHPSVNGGVQILRRGYSYDDGVAQVGPLSDSRPHSHELSFDAGLAFVAFMRDPKQFVRLQNRLSRHDSLNEYITHVGSALFAVPPGARPGGYVGETLLG